MRKIILSIICLLAIGTTVYVNSAFTIKKEIVRNSTIDFKIENNTGAEFNYCVNGGHNYINNGSTKSFSYSEGQDFYYIEGGNCGKLWFKVSSSMSGKTYKVTDL
jgi:hypothetical protein